MKLDDFTKYKKLAESADPNVLPPEALRIYQWMEEKGRIDEGLWSSIWRWLKKNFSPTAVKLNKLADEYEKELQSEMEAEFAKHEDKKDIASKLRSSYTWKMSPDIENRMETIAKDDEVYRDLVRILLNKKRLAVKRKMFSAYANVMSPDDKSKLGIDLDNAESKVKKDENDWFKNQDRITIDKLQKATKELSSKIGSNLSKFSFLFDNEKEKSIFVQGVISHLRNQFDNKKAELDGKNAYRIANEYADAVKSSLDKLKEKSKKEKNELRNMFIRKFNFFINDMKKYDLGAIKDQTYKETVKELESTKDETTDTSNLSTDIVTDTTEEVTDVPVEDMVDTAKDETGKKNPTKEEISEEIKDTIKQYFTNSFDTFFENLKTSVEKFNNLSDEEKTKLKGKFEYTLDKDNKLPIPTEDDVKTLLHDFVKIAGKIVPFYQHVEKSAKTASIAVSDSLFEIYAIKKDVEKKLSEDDIDKIVEVIKTKNLL